MSIRALDLTERVVVLVFYVLSTVALAGQVWRHPEPGNLLVMAASFVVVVFVIVRRRPERMSTRPSDWLIAITGTVAPVLSGAADGPGLVPSAVGTTVAVVGMAVSLLAKLTLRRNFSIVPARTGIVVRGPYRLVRHPMYSGYVITQVGILMYGFTVRNLVCYAICWGCLWLRMGREEAVLEDVEAYRSYRSRVPYRILWGLV